MVIIAFGLSIDSFAVSTASVITAKQSQISDALIITIFFGGFHSAIPFIGWIAAILVFVLWLSGLIYALQGEKKPVYLIGDFFQELFSSIR